VYWGGAAIAFLIDVKMREQTEGKLGFDDAMIELRRCCGDGPRRGAQDLLAHLDQWYGKPIFTEIARQHLDEHTFPPVEEAFDYLGVRFFADRAELEDSAPLAAYRKQIMAPRAAVE
jgi:predicted metalloprotease with PDZ domain